MAPQPALKTSTRDRLLEAGFQVVLTHGLRELTVREVAKLAQANLGSFVYHFGTRDAFVEGLIEAWYAPLFTGVTRVAQSGGQPLDRLRGAILSIVDFSMEHDGFMGRILMAAADNDEPARKFVRTLAARHPRVLLQLVAEAQAAGRVVDDDPLQIVCFLMASVALPRLVASVWRGPALFGKDMSVHLGSIVRDRARLVQRLDWAIKGITPGGV